MLVLAIVLSLLICSIPTGVIAALYFGDKDPRDHGSKNIGMTNAWRVGGAKIGLLTLTGDLAKSAFILGLFEAHLLPHELGWLAFCATLFHCYSMYLNFNGGKGLATASGALLILNKWCFGLLFVIWMSTRLLTKSSSLSAIVTIAVYIVLCNTMLQQYQTGLLAISLLVLWRHRDNVLRLVNNREI